jgi:LemA protein
MRNPIVLFALFIGLITLNSCGYNSIVEKREEVGKQWANVESAYQRRADLVPNLVRTVKAAADFEQKTLTQVIEARSKATSIQLKADDLTEENLARFQAAQDELKGALSRLMVTVEQYPQLRATQQFADLQVQLEGTENRINVERNKFNEAVGDYNQYIQKIPQNIYAGWFGFTQKSYFKSDVGAEKAPEVQF